MTSAEQRYIEMLEWLYENEALSDSARNERQDYLDRLRKLAGIDPDEETLSVLRELERRKEEAAAID